MTNCRHHWAACFSQIQNGRSAVPDCSTCDS